MLALKGLWGRVVNRASPVNAGSAEQTDKPVPLGQQASRASTAPRAIPVTWDQVVHAATKANQVSVAKSAQKDRKAHQARKAKRG